MQRKLAAILAADVVGYSRLMEADEAATLTALKARRKEILQPLLSKHHGRIVKVMGDGMLIEFGSAVEAVQCAVDLQEAMSKSNEGLSAEKAILLRIGVNLGDVVIEGGDLFGDGVNVATRLEALADPGGICVSAPIRNEVHGRLNVHFEDGGEVTLKNLVRPVHVFRVGSVTDASVDRRPQEVGTKPSIAVLPFTNMSGEPEQQYFSDGITEDIITELSRFHSLFVIARNSSFQYRAAGDVKKVARSLGVQYVVEGSVRKLGGRIRVTAQLVEAATGNHLWAERYDRDMQDLFAVQDEVTQAIASTIEGRMAASGAQRSRRKPTGDLAAYDYFLQGRENIERRGDPDVAGQLLRRAIELDPGFAQAYAWLCRVYIHWFHLNLRSEVLHQSLSLARKAVSLDEADAWCHAMVGYTYLFERQYDLAELHLDRAVALNPVDTRIASMRAMWLAFEGRGDEAVQSLDIILRRDPFPTAWVWDYLGIALFQVHRYEEATQALNRLPVLNRWNYYYLTASYAHLGQIERARTWGAEMLRLHPDFTLEQVGLTEVFKDPADLDYLLDGLRKAGLPGS
jgi:adenylate cyclase